MTGIKARNPDITIIQDGHDVNYLNEVPSRAESLQCRTAYVEHSEGCGRQGRGIFIPKSFLDSHPRNTDGIETSEKLAEAFVNKWIDFRFGVFHYESSKSERRNDSFVNMNNETIDGVSCSIDQLLRSEQAMRCDGKSYEEVIANHPDLSKGN